MDLAAAKVHAPRWMVVWRDRLQAKRDAAAWWWEGWRLRRLDPWLHRIRERWVLFLGRVSDRRFAISAWWSRKTEPWRAWWAEHRARATERGEELGERVDAFRAAHIAPVIDAMEARLPTHIAPSTVREGWIVLKGDWQKIVLACALAGSAAIIWRAWKDPTPPPASEAEIALMRGFTAQAPKKFDFKYLVNPGAASPAPGRAEKR